MSPLLFKLAGRLGPAILAKFFFASWIFLAAFFQAPDILAAPAVIAQNEPEFLVSESGDPESIFTFNQVMSLAWEAAANPFDASAGQAPEGLKALSEADWNRIQSKDERRLWSGEGLPFEVGFFHPGFIYDHTVSLNVVENGQSTPLPFAADLFDYQGLSQEDQIRRQAEGFAGFRLHYPLNHPDTKDETVVFLGATHFRALARHTGYGLMARGLILNPAQAEGEEFPYFRQFWLVKPKPEDTSMRVYALLEAPSLTGAFYFRITPGPSTVMEVSARLYQRQGSQLPQKIGLAPLSSMYLHSEKEGGSRFDYRPEVHNSDVLLFTGGGSDWTRRPLSNPERLESHAFALPNPRGFGLMQQDDNFDHYQDFQAGFERRPSLWIEPRGDWGPGRLELFEIPSNQEIHDNILAFWTPDEFTNFGQPDAGTPEGGFSFSYRMYWMVPNAVPHQLGRAVATRLVRAPKSETADFYIDFEGENLNALSADTGLSSLVDTDAEHPVVEKRLRKNPVTGGWRLEFKVRAPQENGVVQSLISSRAEGRCLRVRALLKKGENLPEPLTETWVYDLPY